jgi:hypothetical protein
MSSSRYVNIWYGKGLSLHPQTVYMHTPSFSLSSLPLPSVSLSHYLPPHQAIWALGNIAGDSAEYRDIVLSLGVMEPLISLLSIRKDQLDIRTVRNASWALSNLCRGRNPPPDMEIVSYRLFSLLRNTILLYAHPFSAIDWRVYTDTG